MADAAIHIDPNNGYFFCVRAVALYSTHRDNEALKAIHQAAKCMEFTNYAHQITRATDHLVDLRGGFCPDYRTVQKSCTAYPDSDNLRNVAKITAYLAKQKILSGDVNTGIIMATDLADTGYAMARDSESIISSLIGANIFSSGVLVLDPAANTTESTTSSNNKRYVERATKYLEANGYTKEAEHIRYQTQKKNDLSTAIKRAIKELASSEAALSIFNNAFYIQTQLLEAICILLIIWIILRLLTSRLDINENWDRRATIVSVMLAGTMVAFFAGIMVHALRGNVPSGIQQTSDNTWYNNWLNGLFWFAFLLLAISKLVVSRRSKTSADKARAIPVVVVVIAGLSVMAGIAINAYGLSDAGNFQAYWQQILQPIVCIILYSGLRALWLRRVTGNRGILSTFATTLRLGSAAAVLVFTLAYILMIPIICGSSSVADRSVKEYVTNEAAVIHQVFK